jgi:hypothetical protein
MTNLTDAQRVLLTAATADPDGAATGPHNPKTASSLIKRGFVISLPVDGGESRLVVTEAGRAAIADTSEEADGDETEHAGEPDGADEHAEPEAAVEDQAAAAEAESETQAEEEGTPDAPAAPTGPRGKLGKLVELLKRPTGATVEQMMAATGWQAHSVRGAISGNLKKKLSLTITSEKTEAGRIYKIVEGEGA